MNLMEQKNRFINKRTTSQVGMSNHSRVSSNQSNGRREPSNRSTQRLNQRDYSFNS